MRAAPGVYVYATADDQRVALVVQSMGQWCLSIVSRGTYAEAIIDTIGEVPSATQAIRGLALDDPKSWHPTKGEACGALLRWEAASAAAAD